jgi:hypothetical protein
MMWSLTAVYCVGVEVLRGVQSHSKAIFELVIISTDTPKSYQ